MERELGLKTKPKDWKLMTLGEYLDSTGGSIQTGPFGSQLHASDYVEVGTPSVMPKNISVEGINTDDIAMVSDDDMQRLSKYHLASGDIVYSRRGDVEKCALVKEPEAGWLCGTGCLRVRLGSSNNAVSAEFLHAYLSSPMIREWISRNAVGATMPNLNTSILRDVPLLLPSVRAANGIGRSWAALNNKITLNSQINQTLEQMAQTLFKSWFVDFDPVIDNALDAGTPIPDELQHRALIRQELRKAERQGQAAADKGSEGFKPLPASLPKELRQLFPDAFEESELGWVPKGWEVSTAGDEFTVKGGSTPSTKTAEFWEGGNIHWTSPKDLSGKAEKIMLDTERKITTAGLKKITSGLLPENTVLMSSRAPIGYLALAKIPVAVNQGYIAIPSTTRLSQEYALYWLASSVDEIKGIAGGTTFAEISKKTFKSIQMTVPNKETVHIFSKLASDYLDKISSNAKEVNTLTKLRDTLLPKLISGELRLDDVEAAVEQETVSA